MNGLDRAAFYWINGWPEWLTPLMRLLSQGTDAWPGRLALLAALVALLWRRSTRLGGAIAALGWPLANLVTDVWKTSFPFARPCNELPDVIARVGISQSMGTASAHSANMAFVAVALWLGCGRGWGAPFAALAFGVGLSRIYVGVHYPSQVLFGWATGAFVAWLVVKTCDAGRKVFVQREDAPSGEA